MNPTIPICLSVLCVWPLICVGLYELIRRRIQTHGWPELRDLRWRRK